MRTDCLPWWNITAAPRCAEAILDGMRAHAGSVGVQALGCEGLATLASDNVAARGAIIAAGGVEIVLAAMHSHAAKSVPARLRVMEHSPDVLMPHSSWLRPLASCIAANVSVTLHAFSSSSSRATTRSCAQTWCSGLGWPSSWRPCKLSRSSPTSRSDLGLMLDGPHSLLHGPSLVEITTVYHSSCVRSIWTEFINV